MSEAATLTEQDYEDAKDEANAALVRMLAAADAIGKPMQLVIAEFQTGFVKAVEGASA